MNASSSPAANRLVAALAIGLCALLPAMPAMAGETVKGVTLDAAFKPAEQAQALLKIADAGKPALVGIKRAAISSFQVEFVTKGAASASSYEIGRKGRAGTNVVITLVGVGAPDFQSMADTLYADFVNDLTAMGVEVLPAERVVAAAAYQKMIGSAAPGPINTRTKDTWSSVYSSGGLAVYGIGSTSSAMPMFAGFSAFAAVSGTIFGNVGLQKELDAALINVRLVVNFVDLKSSDSSWFSRSSGTATVNMQYTPSIAPTQSFMSIQQGAAGGTLALHAPLLIDSSAFKEVKDTSSIAANIGLAVLSLAIGGGGSQTAVEKEVVAEPEQYRAVVGAAMGSVREMFMERLRSAQ